MADFVHKVSKWEHIHVRAHYISSCAAQAASHEEQGLTVHFTKFIDRSDRSGVLCSWRENRASSEQESLGIQFSAHSHFRSGELMKHFSSGKEASRFSGVLPGHSNVVAD